MRIYYFSYESLKSQISAITWLRFASYHQPGDDFQSRFIAKSLHKFSWNLLDTRDKAETSPVRYCRDQKSILKTIQASGHG